MKHLFFHKLEDTKMRNEDSDSKTTSKSTTPNNSSKIVLNCSKNFNSLRIEDPKRASGSFEDLTYVNKIIAINIPQLSKHFSVQNKVGEGTFSKVFRAKSTRCPCKEYALKCVIPTVKPARVAAELRFLRDLGGKSNVVPIYSCLFGGGFSVIVMPYFKHDSFTDYVRLLSAAEIRDYMKNLLIALQHVHAAGIIHRDIKPSNFLFNRVEKKYMLVDFGLAQSVQDLQRASKTIKAATSTFRVQTKTQILKDSTKASANKVLATQNSKVPLIRKRSVHEILERCDSGQSQKKMKFNSPYQSTVFYTPTSPRKTSESLNPICKTPMKCPPITKENLLMTPSRNTPTTIIPETPQKSTETPKAVPTFPLPQQLYEKQSTPNIPSFNLDYNTKCSCFGKPQICNLCIKRQELFAPRAGTPGFRAPEVLLKHLYQTTAIDMWSAGVIFASLLSTRYPFFRNIDDLTSLAEIVTVLGTARMTKAAASLGKHLIMSVKTKPPLCLKVLCEKLRGDTDFKIDESAYDLLGKLLEPEPDLRMTADEALQHPYIKTISLT